ncbi:nucleotidyl transferase AbiEii/AbiGii toxin family protein [Oscillatoria sp. CS-180]|uniref:nucleotidyl transferase AbiEii/AbiGii toxin family protein n=1 Tax=Oscillatoria sp. CS-180 TaxID=3021720 RepID=UPI00232D60BE|nr:nucleotidyl transferase AbiEii/AbiGii toxin family protein [Oscillatoria sp. CS-180]MDB9526953.1 nucleotidyl transferase AbiEii/AbiGii toxin family protein [Oscillatoria sp. CS-180]
MKTFEPNLATLPSAQLALWPNLAETPKDFVLYGGTAIALQLGHRKSIDFDFFSHKPFNPDNLHRTIPYLQQAEAIQREPNTLTCLVNPENTTDPVKVSFFGDLPLQTVRKPLLASDNRLKVADLLDLLGTKCATVSARIEQKDYIDIHAILQRTQHSLSDGLAAAKTIYNKQYHPFMTLKALSSYKEGDLNLLKESVKHDLQRFVRQAELAKIPRLKAFGVISATKDNSLAME